VPRPGGVPAARVLEIESPSEIAKELARTDSDPEGVGIMTRKARIYPIRLDGVSLKAAPLLKQELLAVGGDSAHARGVADHSVSTTRVVTLATWAQYRRVIEKLRRQPFGLAALGDEIDRALTAYRSDRPRMLKGLHRSVALGSHPLVMGVLNVTPDSFSDGGRYAAPDAALRRAEEMVAEGAAVLDVGAESTRPGAREVSDTAEWARLEPVLRRLAVQSPVPISVDTRHPTVAVRALDAGADLINDVGGLRDPMMRKVAARTGAPFVVMHMRGTPETMQGQTGYADLRGEVYRDLAEATETALREGVHREALLVDPGLGFGKTAEQNLDLLAHLGEFRSLGFPVVIGASRKSFLGAALNNAPVGKRMEAGLAAAVLAAWEGAQIVRTHDVLPTVRALRLTEAVRSAPRGAPAGPEGDRDDE